MRSIDMVTISPKYQVVIPRKVRETLGLRPGEKVQVFVFEGRIELVPIRSIKKMRGFLKGLDTSVPRDEDRE
jgi:AbrB family looped-hinge helix DNA binding protein